MYGEVKGLQPLLYGGGRGAASKMASDRDRTDLQSTQECVREAACSSWKLYLLNYKQTYVACHEHVLVIYNLVRILSPTVTNSTVACLPEAEAGEEASTSSCVSYTLHSTLLPGTEHQKEEC